MFVCLLALCVGQPSRYKNVLYKYYGALWQWWCHLWSADLHKRSCTYHEVSERSGGTERDKARHSTQWLQRPRHRETFSVMHSVSVSFVSTVVSLLSRVSGSCSCIACETNGHVQSETNEDWLWNVRWGWKLGAYYSWCRNTVSSFRDCCFTLYTVELTLMIATCIGRMSTYVGYEIAQGNCTVHCHLKM